MADKKISQLTALSAANLASSTDVLAIVDTSATETKKIVAQDLVNGVLNVASAVGIGTTSPAHKLDAVGQIRAQESGTGSGDGGLIGATSSANGNAGVLFQTGGSSRWNLTTAGTNGANLRIYNYTLGSTVATFDSSGNLGLGTTSPGSFSGTVKLVVGSAATTTTPGAITVYSGTATYGGLYFADGTVGDQLYRGAVEYNHSTDALLFYSSGTERGRFTAGGEFLVNATATVNASIASIVGTASTNVLALKNGDNGNYFLYCASTANAERLRIEGDGDVYNLNGTYGTISDIKHKQDVIDAPSQWDDLKAVRFRKYRMKTDVETNPDAPFMLGVVAQELEQTSPGLVDEHPDFEEQEVADEDGNVTTEKVQVGTTKTVKSSILLMKAAVALQEAMARIEQLEAKVAALESA